MDVKSKVLALKYRPVVFEDIIGQKIVSDTIFKSIKINKTPNAYLFTGIRGIGKTTFARIVAKALNCKNDVEKLSLRLLLLRSDRVQADFTSSLQNHYISNKIQSTTIKS